jgi:16S rRNA (guanine1207-N2)-methyltransferase
MKASLPEDLSYTQPQSCSAVLNGQPVCFFSKPGLPVWEQVAPPARLLAEFAQLAPAERALLLGCGHGASGVALARRLPRGELWLADHSFLALQLCAQTLQVNAVGNAHLHAGIDLPADQAGCFDAVLIDLPKGRRLAQRWLLQAWLALRPGGALFLAGARQQGIQPAIQDAQALFGEHAILAYKKGCRLAQFRRPAGELPGQGWPREPGIAPGDWLRIPLETRHGRLELDSLPGVFSYDRLDPGSGRLLDHLRVAPTDRVLDLGCGYGIIGLTAALDGAAQVDLLDADLLAVACASRNLAAYAPARGRCLPSDVLSAVRGQSYTLIASNPPFHTGHAVDYLVAQAFIQQSCQALEPGGRLVVVANQFIQYERLMKALFAQVDILQRDRSYMILQGVKS